MTNEHSLVYSYLIRVVLYTAQKSTFVAMAISIYFQDVKRPYFVSNKLIRTWIPLACLEFDRKVGDLTFIFVSDSYLLEMNQQFLQHDYYTDIITFDHGTVNKKISGELYMSIDRIKENAIELNQKYELEFHRVIAHGVLHIIGYQDKTINEQINMRTCESQFLDVYLSLKSK
jgi:probable rRNA maturation factor